MNIGLTSFPSQKVPDGKKTESWGKECIDAAENMSSSADSNMRQTQYNKKINYDLFNNKLNTKDIESILNPMGMSYSTFPARMQHYPVANTKIEELIGEEPNRRFDYIVRVINDDAISSKETDKKNGLLSIVGEFIKSNSLNDDDLKEKIKNLSKYHNYEYQDIRELTATRILGYFYKTMNLRGIFNSGFADALVIGEECYCVDIIGGEPVVRKPNMQNMYVLRNGESSMIDDADIIIESCYKSIGQVIDEYYEYLTPGEIDQIEGGYSLSDSNFVNYQSFSPNMNIQDLINGTSTTDLIYVNDLGVNLFGVAYDENGNVKILKVTWKSMKKVGKITYSDNFGNEFADYVPGDYKPEKGNEKIEWLWVSEWWEGTKIGNDIYIKIQPRPFQMRRMDNVSVCKSGYIGNIYSFNGDKAQSLMDRMKPFQYLYNIFMYRTELAFAKSKGKIAELNLAMKPEGWDIDKWMYYIDVMGLYIVNPFSEMKEGQAKGKLAGTFNTVGGRTMDMETGNYIQQHISMLQYIEQQIGSISGVPKQREGHIEQRDAVKNVQAAVTQSSYITERWFMTHDNIKTRVLEALLEAAKQAWRGKSKKVQYVLDDLSTVFINMDDDFINSEYGIYISTVLSDNTILNDIKQAVSIGIQRDRIGIKSMIDIYLSDSVSSMRRKIEQAEDEAHQRQMEIAKAQQESTDKAISSKMQSEQNKINADFAKQQKEHELKIEAMGKDKEDKKELMSHEAGLDSDKKK